MSFDRLARRIADAVGNKWASIVAVVSVLVWGVSGPLFHYSDTWQLIINTSTTVITFLMVFVIQNTQNNDTKKILRLLRELADEKREK